jgi:hypothetical protein
MPYVPTRSGWLCPTTGRATSTFRLAGVAVAMLMAVVAPASAAAAVPGATIPISFTGVIAPARDEPGDCSKVVPYPGDNASKVSIAQWMAHGARARGVPGELPVMAALAESNLHNLNFDDIDSAGYFQQRKNIWNTGAYSGFPDHPELQLTWFIDQAITIRHQHQAAGDNSYGSDPSTWGMWAADVVRAPEQFRGRYQPRLAEARALIGPACVGDPPPSAADDSYLALQESPLRVRPPGVLSNDSVNLRSTLAASLVQAPKHGTLTLATDGGFLYQGREDYVGAESFSYRAHASTPAAVNISVRAACAARPATIVGTPGSDLLIGTAGDDVIVGLGGQDIVVGGNGNDLLCGGGDTDILLGGPGNDRLAGGSAPDICLGDAGTDSATGCEWTP